MIYAPREDSFLIAEQVKKFVKKSMKVLDIGSGSGILAELALSNGADVLAVDIDEEAVNLVRKKGIKAIKSDLFENVKGKFDLILFNPPYLPEIKNEDKKLSLQISGGKKGSEIIERFLKDAKKYLNENGKILIVFSSLTKDTPKIIKKYKYKAKKLSEKTVLFETIYCYLLE